MESPRELRRQARRLALESWELTVALLGGIVGVAFSLAVSTRLVAFASVVLAVFFAEWLIRDRTKYFENQLRRAQFEGAGSASVTR